jgi:hypothetical protein
MNAIELCANHILILKKELEGFIQEYNGDQPFLISALAEKIEHMCVQIGSPSSVMPMLKSIVNGKIKTWSTNYDNFGEKLNPRMHRAELERKHCDLKHKQIEGTKGDKESHWRRIVITENFIKGHFRWNHGGTYIANYHTRDYIKAYFIDKNVDAFIASSTPKSKNFRLKMLRATASQNSPNMYIVSVTTPKDNDYRFFYYVDKDLTTSNFGKLEDVTEDEITFVKDLINDKFKKKF